MPDGYWQEFVEFAELTDVGLRRANNQDSKACMLGGTELDFFRRGHLFMVAEGMGRHAAGELASKISCDTVPLEYFKRPDGSPPAALQLALEEGNRRIFERGTQNIDFKGMGTTTSVLVLLPQGALCGHVGDSRVYRLRGNRLEQLTFDHSVVWEMRAVAKQTGAEIPGFIPKNYITRSLGHDPNVRLDLEGPFPLAAGDTFLLCSDGLSGQVEDDEMGCLLSCLTPAEAAQTFIDLANLRGGPDNITVIVAKVGDLRTVQNAKPPKLPGRSAADVVHPIIWACMGTAAVVGAVLAVTGKVLPGLAASAVAILLGLYAVAKLTTGNSKKLSDLADKLETQKEGEKAAQIEALKETMRQLKQPGQGPLNEFTRQLAKGDFNKAQEQLQELSKQLANDQMNPEEKAEAKKQMENLAKQLEKLANDQQDLAKKLEQQGLDKKTAEELAKKASTGNPEDLKQAMEQAKNLTPEQQKQLMEMAKSALQSQGMCDKMSESLSKMAQGMSQEGLQQEGMEGMSELSKALSEAEMIESDMQNLDASRSTRPRSSSPTWPASAWGATSPASARARARARSGKTPAASWARAPAAPGEHRSCHAAAR